MPRNLSNRTTHESTTEGATVFLGVHPNETQPDHHASDGFPSKAPAEFGGVHHSQDQPPAQENNGDLLRDQRSSSEESPAQRSTEPDRERETLFGGVFLDSDRLVEPLLELDPSFGGAPDQLIADESEASFWGVHAQIPAELDQVDHEEPTNDSLEPTEANSTPVEDRTEPESDEGFDGAHLNGIKDGAEAPVKRELGEATEAVTTSSDSQIHRAHPNSPSTPEAIHESVSTPVGEANSAGAPHEEHGLALIDQNASGSRGQGRKSTVILADRISLLESDPLLAGAHHKNLSPDEKINGIIVEHLLGLTGWDISSQINLSQVLRLLLTCYQCFLHEGILPTDWNGVPIALPQHIRVTFEPRPVNELGSYIPGRALGDGALYRFNFNPRALVHRGLNPAQLAAMMLYLACRLCEALYRQKIGKKPKDGSYHSVEFRRRLKLLGINCSSTAVDLDRIEAGSPIAEFCERHGIPGTFEKNEGDEAPKTRPKRVGWRCACENAPIVMVARASKIDFTCNVCKEPVLPVEPKEGSTSPGE